ncbi:MAG TPA: Spy/CpxP family protein refolding chaperone [Bryobacteraceae bacterium]|nr:Spy/CpxP family protein refolding chaperone [Bryobacteraceae bacterium]
MYLKLFLIGALAAGLVMAQDEGGGGGGMSGGGGGSGRGGGGGGLAPAMPGRGPATPLERLTSACNLSKDQTKQFSTILSAASKEGAPLREQIPGDRKQIAAAILAGKSADEIKKLTDSDAMAMAQMTQLEMKTFGELYKILSPDQRKSGAQAIFNSLGGMFMKKNWNE